MDITLISKYTDINGGEIKQQLQKELDAKEGNYQNTSITASGMSFLPTSS